MISALNKVSVSSLPNGVQVGLREVNDAQQVVLCFAIGAGMAYENELLNGIAHMVTHMVTHMNVLGTSMRTGLGVFEEVEGIGSEVLFYVHPERTEYYLHLPFCHVKKGIEVMADCLLNTTFSLEALEREKRVVEQEIMDRLDDPFLLALSMLNKASFSRQG